MVDAKTLNEHREYLHDIVKLQLCYAWQWKQAHPDEDFVDVFRKRIDIYRKTDINTENLNPGNCNWDDPAWQNLERQVLRAHDFFTDDAEAFEMAAFEVIKPHVDGRCQRDFEDRSATAGYQCGSLRYHKIDDKMPQRVFVHVANAIAPRSIFEDPEYLPSCFHDLMAKSAAEHQVTELYTSTWLNSHPVWLKLFPAVWQERMEEADKNVQWHFGFWGQFINARGTFNHKLGKQMRASGEFPYWPRRSWCSFDELKAHLATLSL